MILFSNGDLEERDGERQRMRESKRVGGVSIDEDIGGLVIMVVAGRLNKVLIYTWG